MNWKRTARWSLLILPFLLLAIWPAAALASNSTLYEVTERTVFLDSGGNPTGNPANFAARVGTAAIMGTAAPGSAVCPGTVPCSIIATGTSVISLVHADRNFGKGSFFGDFAVVVNEPGTVDAPEVVTSSVGSFAGNIDLLPAILAELGLGGAPLGSLTGLWCLGVGCTPSSHTLNGTFRLPFTSEGVFKKLQKSPFLLPSRGVRPAFYLLDDGRRAPVRDVERSLGAPTVRLEATFTE